MLAKIVAATKKRVALAKEQVPLAKVQEEAWAGPATPPFSFAAALRQPDISFICEVKKASPSKGLIAPDFPYLTIGKEYEAAGATAISVLTEPEFFQGSNRYLQEMNETVNIPLLRKDFIIDPYQIYEAKALGAAAILLICALLDTATLQQYLAICQTLGLCALVETHTKAEVSSALQAGARIIGVNNRNLQTFTVDLQTALELRPLVPKDILFIAESGIQTAADVAQLRQAGVDGVLIGETLMKSPNKKEMLQILRGNQR